MMLLCKDQHRREVAPCSLPSEAMPAHVFRIREDLESDKYVTSRAVSDVTPDRIKPDFSTPHFQ